MLWPKKSLSCADHHKIVRQLRRTFARRLRWDRGIWVLLEQGLRSPAPLLFLDRDAKQFQPVPAQFVA